MYSKDGQRLDSLWQGYIQTLWLYTARVLEIIDDGITVITIVTNDRCNICSFIICVSVPPAAEAVTDTPIRIHEQTNGRYRWTARRIDDLMGW